MLQREWWLPGNNVCWILTKRKEGQAYIEYLMHPGTNNKKESLTPTNLYKLTYSYSLVIDHITYTPGKYDVLLHEHICNFCKLINRDEYKISR